MSTDYLLFHGFIAVAPLKLFWRGGLAGREEALPRLHRRGPIEAYWRETFTGAVRNSSTASSPWPH